MLVRLQKNFCEKQGTINSVTWDAHIWQWRRLLFQQPIISVVSLTLLWDKMSSTVDNLADLDEISEPTILHETRHRYYNQEIYTNVGSDILLALNPNKDIDIYNGEIIDILSQNLDYVQRLSPKSEPYVEWDWNILCVFIAFFCIFAVIL